MVFRLLGPATILCCMLVCPIASVAGDAIPKMTLDEAYAVAIAAFSPTSSPNGVGMDECSPNYENGFYQLLAIPTFPGAEGVGPFLAVNAWTGDVWDVEYCHGHAPRRIITAAARKLQLAIRKRLGISEKAYRRLANRRPLCQFP